MLLAKGLTGVGRHFRKATGGNEREKAIHAIDWNIWPWRAVDARSQAFSL